MMRLETVDIVGFKSFCDKQELSFKGGVTGIVGPNGCGKSNISDAISWVLGEQSAKSLRGAAMEDVIFAGSQSRQPVGMAEVSLKVSGLNGNSPDGNPECTVTRRLYRNGESEYLMNGEVCRLRDIHELFMDTGLGSKAYSIIEQGKIGQILSGKPADRRALIEEAAGITKYRARRRQTQLKLEAAQQNLLRVNDIVHEVEKQLDSLKRQASRARRYRIVRDEMQALERILYGRRFVDLRAQAESLTVRIAAEGGREQSATVALESEEAQMEVRRTVLHEDETLLQDVRARLSELTLAVDRHQGRSGYCKEQIAETEARADEARREAGDLEARMGPLAEHLVERQAEETRLRAELATAGEEARASEAAVQEIAAAQARAEAELESSREAQLTVLSRIAALQNARESVSGNAERAAAVLLKLAAESAEMERESARVTEQRDGAQRRQEDADELLARLSGERADALARATAAREAAESMQRDAHAAQSERDGLAGRLSSLEEIVATHAAFDEGVRALLAGPNGIEVLGVVADAVETDSQFERAVEALFGDRLQAVMVPDASHALRGIAWLEESGAGRGTFLPLASARKRNECSTLRDVARVEPGARGLIADLFRVSGPHADAIKGSLPDALVVETLEQALSIVARRGPVSCVTLAGEILRGSMVEGGRAVKGLLAPRREIKEVQVRLEALDTALLALRRQVAEHEDVAAAASAEARGLEERIHAAEKDLVAIRHDLAAAQEERARLVRKAAVLDSERQQAEDERGAAAVRLAEIEQGLIAGETDRESGSARVSAAATMVAEARAAADAAQARFSEARSLHAALGERTVAIEAECRRIARDHQELAARAAGARTRAAEMDQRRGELIAERENVERLLAEALTERDRVAGEATLAEDRVRDLRNEIDGREAALKERRREREMLKEALTELEVMQARTGADLDHLGRECHQAVAMMAAEAAALLTEENLALDISGVEVEIQEMRERLEKMGPVNILAVEQSAEFEERHTFLIAQRQDLLDSIAELDQAIKRIDKTSKERFREAFDVINGHFSEIFRQLFGGGSAGLTLLDEDDVLESGIDVMAQPPGKRLQSVMLLSGGEKALTAISLLFAIFQYKPSPFCILDEVDAPLDDANIGRFVRMLDGLKEQTQFVLITHSRKTMEIADQLYGVTMEEPGVSKLVSVRFS